MQMANMDSHNDEENNEHGLPSITGVGEGGGGGEGASGAAAAAAEEEVALKKGPWTAAEDAVLIDYVTKHGEGNWNAVQRNTGLARCGKSCRLRWTNHLRPNLKKGAFSPEEEKLILELHAQFGNKWARMATLLPGRTDNEIKNYWNTRMKRRQRQGLPLYSNDSDHLTTSTAAATSGTRPVTGSTATKLDYYNQNCYPLSSLHTGSSYSTHTPFLDPNSLSSSSSFLTFPSQQPTSSLYITPLNSKRCHTTFSLPNAPSTTPFVDLDGLNFLGQFSSSSCQIFQTPLDLSSSISGVPNPSSILSTKMELPSNQFSQSNNDLLGDLLLEAQVLVSDQNFRKRTYSSFSEGNGFLDGFIGLDDMPLSSVYWSSGLKPKSEPISCMNELPTPISGIPSTIQVPEWHNDIAAQASSVQSSGATTTADDNNFEPDFKPIASLIPVNTTANPKENPGLFSWDTLPGLC